MRRSFEPRPSTRASRRARAGALLTVAALLAAACSDDDTPSAGRATTTTAQSGSGQSPDAVDRSFYILPPGNYGGIPTTEHSLDQLPLYDGLTPLRGNITDADIEEHFLPQDFAPVGDTTEEPTGRDGVTILYDSYGVAHITGETREDVAFGAGWVTARDRGLLLDLARGPSRAAVADIPGVDAFGLVTSARQFIPSDATEQLLTDQVDLLVEELGPEGEEIVADATAYAEGASAYWAENDPGKAPATVNDIIGATSFIGSIFGAGGGSEADNAELLATLQGGLGEGPGREAWEDVMLIGDPEAPTTLTETFDYPALTGGEVTGSVAIDEGSITSFDATAGDGAAAGGDGRFDAAQQPPDRHASNWLLVDQEGSTNGTTLGVLGPQLGYYYPEIVQQIHLSGPGIEAQGAAVPGLAMYILIGRTPDYAWSLTSAGHDVRDVYAEILCEPDGAEPTIESDFYEYKGKCRPFEIFDAGTLDGKPVSYPTSVHGPVIATATSDGRPVALTRKRSTFGRDVMNLAALKRMTEGEAATADAFYDTANRFGFTFNWGWVGRGDVAYFSSGRLPVRPDGLDRRLPTLGTGDYEWEGFLELDQHPHGTATDTHRLLNWNNQSAPGFMHGDGESFGSVHRVELFDQWPEQVDLAGVVGVMNRSATEVPNTLVWPIISELLRDYAPSPRAQALVDELDEWVADDAPALDADDDGTFDQAGPAIVEALWEPMVLAAIEPVFGERSQVVYERRGLGGDNGASILDKDLRTLMGEPVEGPFNLQYCGGGVIEECRAALWGAIDDAAAALAEEYGSDDPATWLAEGWQTGFEPGLIKDTMRTTNRPTFQQLIELVAERTGAAEG